MRIKLVAIALVLALLSSPVLTGVGGGVSENELSHENEIEEDESYQLTVDFNKSRTAILSVGEEFEIEPGDTFTFENGTEVDIGAFPEHGWSFTEWNGDTENIENVTESGTTITMEDDYEIYPGFVEAERSDVTFEISDESDNHIEGAQVYVYAETDMMGDEEDYIAETNKTGEAVVSSIPNYPEYHYRIYKSGYRGVETYFGALEDDETITDILEEADDTFNLTIDEPEGDGDIVIEHIGTERIDPEEWPFEREYSNNTGVNVFMNAEEYSGFAPYKMYANEDLVHDSIATAHHPAQLEVVEDIHVKPHFTEIHGTTITAEGEGNITIEEKVEPYMDEFEEVGVVEDSLTEDVYQATTYRLTAEPEEGYEFVEWFDEEEEGTYSEDMVLTENFENDTEITAYFDNFYELNITVLDDMNETIENALVELECNETGEIKYEAMTDENGTVYFAEVSEGVYEYIVSHDEYHEEDGTVEIFEDKEITVELEEDRPNYEISDFDVEVEGMEINVTATLEHRGFWTRITVYLVIDGETKESYELDPGDEIDVVYVHEFDEEGQYTIELGHKSETVDVAEAQAELDVTEFEIETEYLNATISGEVVNTGGLEGAVDLIIDDETVKNIIVGADDVEDFEYIKEFDEAGEYTVELGDESQTISVVEEPQAELDVTEFEIETEYLTATISAEVENTGSLNGTLDLVIDNDTVENVTVEANDVEEFDYTHEFDEAGEYAIELGDESQIVEVEEEPQAEFEVSNIEIETIGLEVTINADVENVGDGDGDFELIIDDEVITVVTIAAGESEEVGETHEFEEGGEYVIEMGDETETVDVEPTDFMGTEVMIGLAVVVVLVLAIIGYSLRSGDQDEELSIDETDDESEIDETFKEGFEDIEEENFEDDIDTDEK